MGAYRAVIGCNLEQYETGTFQPNRYLVLDTQETKTVRSRSVIAKQPLQSGDTMSDHMYREPNELNISGAFSINGKNWADDSYDFMQKGDRLTNVQEVFEFIKDNGILCQITTIDEDDSALLAKGGEARTRFKTRNNMALTSITWTERQNSVSYSFDFSEVIMVEAQEYEELSEAEREELGLPCVTSPRGSSLGTVLAETNQLQETILRTLYDNGYIEKNWFAMLCGDIANLVKSATVAAAIIGVGLAVAVITTIPAAIAITAAAMSATATTASILAAAAGSVSAVFPVGTIVVAAAAVLVGLAVGIYNLINYREKKRKQKLAFKLVNGKPDQDTERLLTLFDEVEQAANQAKSSLVIYSISGNHRQTVTINIGGEYYLIDFDKTTADGKSEWFAKVSDMEGKPLTSVRHDWCPVSSFCDLNPAINLWFKDKSKQYEAYLVNPSLSSAINSDPQAVEAAKANLESYSIWVSKGDVRKSVKAVEDAIEKAIESRGFY